MHALTKIALILLSVSCILAVTSVTTPMVTAESAGAPSAKVTVISDGHEWEWVSTQSTVGSLLKEAGVTLGALDRVQPAPSTKVSPGMRIRIIRVTEKIVVQKEPIRHGSVTKIDPRGLADRAVVREGVPGEKEIKYLVTYKDGVKSGHKVLEARVLKQPVDEIVAVSTSSRGMLSSRSGSYRKVMQMQASAYAAFHCGGSKSGRAAMGMPARKGVVAVDPRVIKLGTRLYIDGYGEAIAGDTGGAIKGNRIDLCFNTYGEAIRFGRRTVTVYILD